MKAAMNAAFICNDTEPFKEYGIRVCKHGVERAVQFEQDFPCAERDAVIACQVNFSYFLSFSLFRIFIEKDKPGFASYRLYFPS